MSRVNKPDTSEGARETPSARISLDEGRSNRRSSVQHGASTTAGFSMRAANPPVPGLGADEVRPETEQNEGSNVPMARGGELDEMLSVPPQRLTGCQAPPMSRTASSNTVTQSSHRPTSRETLRAKSSFQRGTPPEKEQIVPPSRRLSQQTRERPRNRPSPASLESSSSSSESESDEARPERSQYLRRPLKFTASKKPRTLREIASGTKATSDEEEEEEPPFLPFSQPVAEENADLGATVRGKDTGTSSQTDGSSDVAPRGVTAIESSASSAASSAAPVQSQRSVEPNALSPRHRAELAVLDAKKKGKGRDGSDDTRSMGSSFSDLDGT